MPLLEIKNLKLEFLAGDARVTVLDEVSLSITQGRTLCLVGESGCGKSVTALSIARLLPAPPTHCVAGEVLLEGRDVLKMTETELRQIRGGVVSYVFQEPGNSLNPVMPIGKQIKESLRLRNPERATDSQVIELLKMAGIASPEIRFRDYPFQTSGGMQQRVMLAMALAAQPKLLVADEPTTALDATIQAQMLELIRDLQHRLQMAILLVTHNLGIVSEMGDEVAVMYCGQLVEQGPATAILEHPLHPYTRALIDCVPRLDTAQTRLAGIPGTVPAPGQWGTGCRFYQRCPSRRESCATKMPAWREARPGRWVRCDYVD